MELYYLKEISEQGPCSSAVKNVVFQASVQDDFWMPPFENFPRMPQGEQTAVLPLALKWLGIPRNELERGNSGFPFWIHMEDNGWMETTSVNTDFVECNLLIY